MPALSKQELINAGFRYAYTVDEQEVYSLRFPVVKFRNIPTVEAEILLSPLSPNYIWTVYHAKTTNIYGGYYIDQLAYRKIKKRIDKQINKKLEDIGFYAKTKRGRKAQETAGENAETDRADSSSIRTTEEPTANRVRKGEGSRVSGKPRRNYSSVLHHRRRRKKED